MKVTTAIILDTRTIRKNGNYTVKLRITFRRKQKYYSLPVEAMSREDFDKTQTTRPRGKFKELAIYFNAYENQARQVMQNMNVSSFEKFANIFLNQAYLNFERLRIS